MSKLPPAELQYQLDYIHENRAPGVVATVSVFGFFALITLVLRFYQRAREGFKHVGLDDYLMLGASVFALGDFLAICLCSHYGVGKHTITITNQTAFLRILQWETVLDFCYPIAITLAKLSILAFVARVFTLRSEYLRWGVWVIAAYNALWCLSSYLLLGLVCKPFSGYWSITKPCHPGRSATIYNGSFNMLGDLAVILLPQPLIWRLHMSLRKKVAVTTLLAAGLFASACNIVKMVISYQLNFYDVTYSTSLVSMFYVLEVLIAITCGNLPAIYQLVSTRFSFVGKMLSKLSFRSRSSVDSGPLSDTRLHESRSDIASWRRVLESKRNPVASDGKNRSEDILASNEDPTGLRLSGQIVRTIEYSVNTTPASAEH